MRATLFAVPASHPSLAAQLMLERKRIEYRRVDLVSGLHRAVVRGLGFPGTTVPALRIDGQRLQGSRTIALALDGLVSEPPLFPREPERREAVLRAEAWGDEVLQPVPRRLIWAALKRDRSTLESFLEGARLGIPTGLAARTAAPIVVLSARLNRAYDDAVRRDLRAVPSLLEHVDNLLRDGAIGGDDPNPADYQIATSMRLLMALEDLRPLIEGQPAARHALAIAPSYPGRMPPVFPREWLPG